MALDQDSDLYSVLGVSRAAKETEIRRAYRNLISKHHPDKGGDPAVFRRAQAAWEVLGDAARRAQYDATGKVVRSVEEEFMDSFAGGNFRDKMRAAEVQQENLGEQIALRQQREAASHSSGFEAWMRSRGDVGVKTYTSEDVIDQFGVVKGSYEAVPLPRIMTHTVRCKELGAPLDVCTVESEALPESLEWGQVLVSIRAAPINPADLYSIQTGTYGNEAAETPFVPGHDGVGVVVKVGPGVKSIGEGDWVVPLRPHVGTWRSLAVVKDKDLLRLPADLMPLEQAAMLREMLTAYRLLEDHGSLKPGDAVILNAANSTVGQLLLQLCALLRLRAVAVVSDQCDFEKTATWLKGLGAADVLLDQGSIKVELEKLKLFAKPKLALDAVGGLSAMRLSDALVEGGQLVVYGSISGRSAQFGWHQWVFQGIQVKGFNVRSWMRDHRKRLPAVLEALGKLVAAGKLQVAYTDYELGTEFAEALEHAMERGRNTKVLLRVSDVGVQY